VEVVIDIVDGEESYVATMSSLLGIGGICELGAIFPAIQMGFYLLGGVKW
jgi:hypothetical protein